MEDDILQIINQALPVAANSTVLIKLIGSIGDIIKTLYEPRLRFRNGKADVDVERYKEGAKTFTLYEITRLRNFLKAAGFASEELEHAQPDEESMESPEFDWLMRFFDAVSLVSSEELQELWGKVLAGEVKKPGACSLRTLDIVRNLSRDEAVCFHELCRYVMVSGNMAFIFDNGFCSVEQDNGGQIWNLESHRIIHGQGLNYVDHIAPMVEAGLLTADHYFLAEFVGNNTVSMGNEKLLCIISSSGGLDAIQFEPYMLTKSGMELFQLIRSGQCFNAEVDYQVCCMKELKQKYGGANFSLYEIHGNDRYEEVEL